MSSTQGRSHVTTLLLRAYASRAAQLLRARAETRGQHHDIRYNVPPAAAQRRLSPSVLAPQASPHAPASLQTQRFNSHSSA